ncbi:hypothetical protein JMN32_07505 [Fulvivirga sp. 29W222]|uniref:Uncharacterized protein n=1 Tax=Fulvivirga marina TaxID=2494733 RepID=A0A937KDE3_9BACT|nr:hypothetical protein [Fulvivirga marina]MBL6446148.1 hypothetical protein [Fulvivirga marina]
MYEYGESKSILGFGCIAVLAGLQDVDIKKATFWGCLSGAMDIPPMQNI